MQLLFGSTTHQFIPVFIAVCSSAGTLIPLAVTEAESRRRCELRMRAQPFHSGAPGEKPRECRKTRRWRPGQFLVSSEISKCFFDRVLRDCSCLRVVALNRNCQRRDGCDSLFAAAVFRSMKLYDAARVAGAIGVTAVRRLAGLPEAPP